MRTPFHKILIANRGEIALRVMRTAAAMGYRTVAVYSSVDADARHVHEADQAVAIGEASPAQSYLAIDKLIAAAKKTGADAIHPGYGFLAENENFARACRDAGLVFIGPSAEVIAAMGDKAAAKKLMQEAGVPCIRGYAGEDQSPARLVAAAAEIDYPVMIKAAAGGGGRGMRQVTRAEDFAELLQSARSEAKHAFGDDRVILEQALIAPRHIEMQILADRYGNAIHLGERDCSVQRRHQKIIEEAPSPMVSGDLREQMGKIAVAAVKAIHYEGVGTLEFLLDCQGNFYFMEMNTRLQVEHPVTEAITGLDLVELQLRIAAGEELPLKQDEVKFSGHAIEVRLCAEDADFLPQSGVMAQWKSPQSLRVESALHPGSRIPSFYDSMLAKIIAHGNDRVEACRKLITGLSQTIALGIKTNQVFLQRCLANPVFARGEATTAFVERELANLRAPAAAGHAAALAAVLLHETAGAGGAHAHLSHTLLIPMRFMIDGKSITANLTRRGGKEFLIELVEDTFALHVIHRAHGNLTFDCDGIRERAAYVREGTVLFLHYRGVPCRIEDTTLAAASGRQIVRDGVLRAKTDGRVVALEVAVGDRVKAGQLMVTLEAMKMEHNHAAQISGKVVAVSVATGDQVSSLFVLAEIEPEVDAVN